MRFLGTDIFLDTLEREDCKKLWQDYEYDFARPTETLRLGHSLEKADDWFEEIQRCQGNTHVRLGIFLNDRTVIGDVALQDIDWYHKSCSVGIGIQKLHYHGKGYGTQAIALILKYGFCFLGLERITANTLECNVGAQKALERCGFRLEGRLRKEEYVNGKKMDKLCYGILKEEYLDGTREGNTKI
jgi:RimJ/RimL family protein N-acetyltransferase